MAGQMSQLERKSIEPIALNVESTKVQAMHHFLSDIVWEEERILSRYHVMVSEDLGDAEGVISFRYVAADPIYGTARSFWRRWKRFLG